MHKSEGAARVGVERPQKKNGKKLDRLTRDVIAAQEAGMSYGQYKALHPHTPDEDDEKKELVIDVDSVVVNCEYCGEPFVKPKNNKIKRFCGATCQNRFNARKRAQGKRQSVIGQPAACAICGAIFTVDHASRLYCSPKCYAESKRRRAQAMREQHQEKPKKEAAKNGSV